MKRLKHGKTNTRLYNTWQRMKQRCYNPNKQHYEDYGGRGIEVCKEWLHDFQAFYDWSMTHGYDDTLTIDRIDVDGNYEPSNCRWVDMKTQCRNRRNTKYIKYKGETKPLVEWCELFNINYKVTFQRLFRDGLSIEDAFLNS